MNKISAIFTKKFFFSSYFYLSIIILIGLIFRIYKLEYFFPFTHDADLYSWIVKDILVDHHFRLIGQLTSIEGVFIGPLFYYILVPFFAIFNMDPVGAFIPSTIAGLLTIISIYYVFSKFFNVKTGIIGSLIYSVSLNIVFYDRWIVPTMFVPLWSIWFLYILLCIQKGNYKKFWILGILVGLIWHIHLALLPLLFLIPIALILSNKRPQIGMFISPILFTLIMMLPFLLFEIRHSFSQTTSTISSFGIPTQEAIGINRLGKIFDASSKIITRSLITPWTFPPIIIYLLISAGLFYLKTKKVLDSFKILIIIFWFLALITAQEISKRGVSEYYFSSLIILPILVVSLFLNYLDQKCSKIKIANLFMLIYLLYNVICLIELPLPGESLAEKKQVVNFIIDDARKNNYSCIQINYITDVGNDTGFRYLFWWKNYQLIKSGSGAPVYSIVLPWIFSPKESSPIFGKIGIIRPPKQQFSNTKVCDNPANKLDPLLGFYN